MLQDSLRQQLMRATRNTFFRVPQSFHSATLFSCATRAIPGIVSRSLSSHGALEERRLSHLFVWSPHNCSRCSHDQPITATIASAIVCRLVFSQLLTTTTLSPPQPVLNFSLELCFLSFHSHFVFLSTLPTQACPTIWEWIKSGRGDVPRSSVCDELSLWSAQTPSKFYF